MSGTGEPRIPVQFLVFRILFCQACVYILTTKAAPTARDVCHVQGIM